MQNEKARSNWTPDIGHRQNSNSHKNIPKKHSPRNSKKNNQLSRNSSSNRNNQRNEMKIPGDNPHGKEGMNNTLNEVCIVCKVTTQLKCERCGDRYCSRKCQQIDFPNHRYICFPLPSLIPTEAVLKSNCNNNLSTNTMSDCVPKIPQVKSSNILTNSQIDDFNIPKLEGKIDTKPNIMAGNIKKFEDKRDIKPNIIAGNMPKLQYEFPSPNNSIVVITAVCNSNTIYCRSFQHNEIYLHNIKRVSEMGETAKRMTIKPAVRDAVLTTYQNDPDFYRARILDNKDENNIMVNFIDFGNVEFKKLSDLREMPEELYAFKVYPFRVKLSNVVQGIWSKSSIIYLKRFETEALQLKMTNNKRIDNNNECELYDIASNECLNKKVMELIEVSSPSQHKKVNKIGNDEPIEPFKRELLPIGEKIPVCVMANSQLNIGMFSCCLNGKQFLINDYFKKLAKFAQLNGEPYKPRPGEYCIASHGTDKWYRAQVIQQINITEMLLSFVDYGEEAPVDIKNIRKFPDHDEAKFPCFTNICLIEDLPMLPPSELEFDKVLTNLLKSFIRTNSQLFLTVNCVKNNVVSVNLDEVTNALRNEQ